MSFAATAVSVGAAAAGSIASGAMASSAAGQSANDIRGQADYNSKVTWQQLQQNDQAFAPWVSGGRTAQGLISYGLGMGGVTDADLTKAQQEYQAALAAFEAGQRQQVKKKYRSRWLAQQEQLKKNLDDAGRRLADIQRAAEVQKSGGVRPGEFSENLWRDFTLADITNDPGYQYLKSRGLIGEGDWKTDPLYRELVSRGILAEGDWRNDAVLQQLKAAGLMGDTWQTDPGYLFRLSEGQKVLENSAAARGGLLSGQTGKALQQYGQNFASNEFGNIYDRYNRAYADAFNRQGGLLSNLYSDIYNRNKGLSDDAYKRHVADYTARVGEREAKFGKLTGQSGQGLQTLGQLVQLAFQGQQANNQGTANAVNAAGNYNVMGANAMASGLSSALNSLGSLAMYAGGGGFGGGGGSSGGGGNTGTFSSNLAKNTAFQNFMPTNYWG